MIVAIAGETVDEPDDVAGAIQDRRPGETVEIEVRRGGLTETLDVRLGTRPAQAP